MRYPILLIAGLLTLLLTGCAAQHQSSQNYQQVQDQIKDSEARINAKLDAQQKVSEEQLKQLKQLAHNIDPKQPTVTVSPKFDKKKPVRTDKTPDGKLILGQVESIWIEPVNDTFNARIDTGATTSSISAQDIQVFERDGKKWVKFNLAHEDRNEKLPIETPLVRYVRIKQASAKKIDRRPVVKLTVRMGDLTEQAEFTLKDRSEMIYPVLIGREFLKDIAVVDVAKKYVQPKPKLLKTDKS
ncbi:ATP-dependent zinc protease family protein [Dongshaea marina]|uniref:ATP-dependent zinc protease family protein n=1 Tax=Dongshaea marina TaxID=2047966 RepID=UPI001F39E65D|nr:ATP-dependent zinc protease [Dongshaea marina]